MTADAVHDNDVLWNYPEPDLDWQAISVETLAKDSDWNSSF